ncbi:hypothetical protein GUJ93_ZPchr0005g14275 [Zizania palustris]|uniref:non-specific serine/threonine protein kinase n=1 Tax=Zizania palustris TaxID=103762 RepID=A0A8J5S8P5_ZIZPA|nr:hypothetical protein GUJ93_ZPchr0005g14275 [Zizania palustris]
MDGRRASASFLAVLALLLSLVVAAAPKVLPPAGEGKQIPDDVASEIQFLYSPELIIFLLHFAVRTSRVARFAAEALVEIRAALRDTGDVLSDWKASSGGDGPCHWMLVTCYDGHVSGLELAHRNLTGTLSPAIGKLRRLRFLFLQHNAISGPIPGTVARLHQLRRLDLSHNHLAGAIPTALGDLRDIFFVRLSSNNLSGSIPDSLAASRSIFFLDLSFNNLSGTVPAFNARNVFLEGNNFSCDKRCSPVTPAPDVTLTATGDPDAHEKRLERTARTVALYIATSLLIAFFVAGIVVAVLQWRRRHQIFADIDDICLGHLKQYMIKEMRKATNNFDRKNILGQGGFGVVYKGLLRDGTIVAVKRMKDCISAGEEDQFHTEVEVISLIVHPNLLHLTGFCATDNERLLVYPYMPNGTVSSKLQEFVGGKATLDWARRRRIALGTARGLVYLHEQCDPKIIHRDIKASNVLLDEHFEAVVADFGLAKLLDHGESHVITAVRGTIGRIPPEYLMTGHSSEKTDVYGFGFLLVELITGRRSMELREHEYQKGGILEWAKERLEEKRLDLFVDSRLRNEYDIGELEEMVQMALLCTMYSPDDRPSMAEIVRMLQGRDGSVAAKWEAVKFIYRSKPHTPEFMLPPPLNFPSEEEYNSVRLEADELSGPR